MDLYNKTIDEFVDWLSGENSFTHENITDGKPVSGGAIRLLLQNKLRLPIYVEEDITNNLYRIFSSRDSYVMWASNPSDNSDLLLFTIPRPSDYKLNLNITNNGDRYIKSGDDTNTLSKILFDWKIYNDEGESSDGLTVTYTILNIDSGSQSTFIRRYNKGVNEDFSIYNYLKTGENRITIEGQGNNTGARNSTSFNINLLDIEILCGFNFASKHTKNEPLRVPYVFTRNNTNGTAKIYFVIDDGQQTFYVDILKGGQTRIEDTGKMISPVLSEGQHSLQVYAETIYNDGLITIYSNLLYFTFVIASSEVGVVNKFINVATSFDNGNYPFSLLTLSTNLYYSTKLRWGYYTDANNTDTSIPVTWKLINNEDSEILSTINANTSYEASELNYIPTITSTTNQLYLSAYFNETQLIEIPIFISSNSELENIYETDNYVLKMSAYGRTNASSDKSTWTDATDTIQTTFHNIQWTPNSGWYLNSFRTYGEDLWAEINFLPLYNSDLTSGFPFTNGRTIEIEFESERINNNSDKLIVLGNPTKARIEITPNTASIYNNSNVEILHTNYKSNERVKIAFIINNTQYSSADSGLIYIINNGILERGVDARGNSFNAEGTIKIGGSRSGVRVFNLRIYDKSITYMDEYNNFVYDSEDKVKIVERNRILNNNSISYDLCKNKIDTILITGDLSNILNLNTDKDDSTTDVVIERTCPYDASRDFIIGEVIDDLDNPGEQKVNNGAMIRKHGQSTLNYPITSMKIWFNKNTSDTVPIFLKNPQENLLLNKNRYKMKTNSIPSNKFVLQANYADSSGVHNGGLLRLIQSSWYNARVDGKYVLRTEPQLFTSIKSSEKSNYGLTHVWQDYFNKTDFPYQIQVSPDSFPCAVFYYDLNGTKTSTFLGMYVFMEDKKSDFLYGERSIYKIANDPFCMTTTNAKSDTSDNRIWSNDNVLRMEVIEVNNRYSSYLTTTGFTNRTGNMYGWEEAFEMIYPDPDDIAKDDSKTGLTKFDLNSKFVLKVTPFINWYNWVVSTKDNQAKFLQEAADHLDLYKMAAYYIFVLRFSLVDSLERNALIKTYDGVHFHYEPWDMDIALGNKNDGGLAFDPPVDRNTKLNTTTYAISGRASDYNGNITISNWLWDALEAWPEWINVIVPKVAGALFNAGLTYDKVSEMFDENYANKWCEIMYNESGHFKYVESAGGDTSRWLPWLQGARMSHRHWWLSTSMDYYDAKWFCGDYKNHKIYLGANITADSSKKIEIIPNTSTFMTVTVNNLDNNGNIISEDVDVTRDVSQENPLQYYMTKGASTKAPIHIYGANFMEEVDMSDIATGIDALDLTGTYSTVLGAPLKRLDIGTPFTEDNGDYTYIPSESTCGVSVLLDNINAFENLEYLNIRGHLHLGNVQLFSFGINQWIRELNMTQLKEFYAAGSNLSNFYSSDSGNKFTIIELPCINVLNMKNSTWNNLLFYEELTVNEGEPHKVTRYTRSDSNYTVHTPSTIAEIHLLGSTGRTRESLLLVRDWIRSIVMNEGEQALQNYVLEMDDVNWNPETIGNDNDLLTYDELMLISKLNGSDSPTKVHPIRGYIMLKYEGQGTELTASQLTEIRNKFGETVFTKGSSGLVVDYKHDYLQINVGGQITIDNNQIYLKEGDRAVLSATEFHLLDNSQSTNYEWGICEPGAQLAGTRYKGLRLIPASDTIDGNTYLLSAESQENQDYTVEIRVVAGGITYTSIINVIAAKYPTNIEISSTSINNIVLRENPSTVALWLNGCGSNLFVTTNDLFTATIRSITYTVTTDSRSIVYSTVGEPWNGQEYNIDGRLTVYENTHHLGLGNTNSIAVVCSNGIPNDNSIYSYLITVVVEFASNLLMTATKKVLILDDLDPIISSLLTQLYSDLSNLWNSNYGKTLVQDNRSRLYRTDLLELTGTFTTTADNIITLNNNYLLEYLHNITGLVVHNASITNLAPKVNNTQTIAPNSPNLTLIDLSGCTSLDATNIIVNPNVTTVNLYNTGLGLYQVDSNEGNIALSSLTLGDPEYLNIVNPSSLTPENITISDNSNLDTVVLDGMPNNGFKIFAKLMNLT